ncbi:MAG: type II toxin-antitoxin system Phd/YefM family antitoxin [Lachnospiraceae bacterium]|nr:type II toxin-antitoxin system Phd/YefM family antitoxin [Lachnospiraceae bacterium]
MTAINATTARKNLYQIIADVNTNSTPVTITNSRGRNAVLLSEDDWNAIQETLYLNSVPGFTESVQKAKKEAIADSAVYEEDEEW